MSHLSWFINYFEGSQAFIQENLSIFYMNVDHTLHIWNSILMDCGSIKFHVSRTLYFLNIIHYAFLSEKKKLRSIVNFVKQEISLDLLSL